MEAQIGKKARREWERGRKKEKESDKFMETILSLKLVEKCNLKENISNSSP